MFIREHTTLNRRTPNSVTFTFTDAVAFKRKLTVLTVVVVDDALVVLVVIVVVVLEMLVVVCKKENQGRVKQGASESNLHHL